MDSQDVSNLATAAFYFQLFALNLYGWLKVRRWLRSGGREWLRRFLGV